MHLHTYRARSLAEALRVVRQELGPDAAVLHTREIGSPLARLLGGRTIEVTASAEAEVPSRLPEPQHLRESKAAQRRVQGAELYDYRRQLRQNLQNSADSEPSLVERLAAQPPA